MKKILYIIIATTLMAIQIPSILESNWVSFTSFLVSFSLLFLKNKFFYSVHISTHFINISRLYLAEIVSTQIFLSNQTLWLIINLALAYFGVFHFFTNYKNKVPFLCLVYASFATHIFIPFGLDIFILLFSLKFKVVDFLYKYYLTIILLLQSSVIALGVVTNWNINLYTEFCIGMAFTLILTIVLFSQKYVWVKHRQIKVDTRDTRNDGKPKRKQ